MKRDIITIRYADKDILDVELRTVAEVLAGHTTSGIANMALTAYRYEVEEFNVGNIYKAIGKKHNITYDSLTEQITIAVRV